MLKHTFSAFWLRSSVVSVLISVKTGIFSTEKQFSHQFLLGAVARRACSPLRQSCLGLALSPSVAHPYTNPPLIKRNRLKIIYVSRQHYTITYHNSSAALGISKSINVFLHQADLIKRNEWVYVDIYRGLCAKLRLTHFLKHLCVTHWFAF